MASENDEDRRDRTQNLKPEAITIASLPGGPIDTCQVFLNPSECQAFVAMLDLYGPPHFRSHQNSNWYKNHPSSSLIPLPQNLGFLKVSASTQSTQSSHSEIQETASKWASPKMGCGRIAQTPNSHWENDDKLTNPKLFQTKPGPPPPAKFVAPDLALAALQPLTAT